MLLPAQPPVQVETQPQPETGKVTYIVDQDLVRFAKFAVAVLAVFLVVGGYLFGFKLESGLEKVQTAQEKSKEILAELAKSREELAGSRKKVDDIQSQFTQAQVELQKTQTAVEVLNKNTQGQFEKANSELTAARQKVEELRKQVEDDAAKSKTSVTFIEQYHERVRTFRTSPEIISQSAPSFDQNQASRLVEVKIMTAFKPVLTPKQYADLEKAIKTPSGLRRAIYDAGNEDSFKGKLVRLEGQPATGDAAATLVYDNIGLVHEFFLTAFGRDINSDIEGPIVATIHYDKDLNNALWDGRQIVIGDGDGKQFRRGGFGSLAIIASQLGHLVTERTAKFVYNGQSGSLNTHFSDVFAVLTEQWSRKQSVEEASWLVGQELLAPDIKGVALRSMKAPGTAYDDPTLGKDSQPSHMKDIVKSANTSAGDHGGVHVNSGIPNRAFYEVSRLIGGYAWEKPGKIWYQSLLKLQSKATFADFARTTYEVSRTLYGEGAEQAAVKKGWELVGISVGS
jgi:hypothetical protein